MTGHCFLRAIRRDLTSYEQLLHYPQSGCSMKNKARKANFNMKLMWPFLHWGYKASVIFDIVSRISMQYMCIFYKDG